jgi:hypothetical protein
MSSEYEGPGPNMMEIINLVKTYSIIMGWNVCSTSANN